MIMRGIERNMEISLKNFIRLMEDDTEYIVVEDDYIENKRIAAPAIDIPDYVKAQNISTCRVRYAPEIDQVVMHIRLA